MTPSQAAALLGVTPRAVLQMIHRELLSASRFGGTWIIKAQDVERAKTRPGPGRPRKPIAK